jgi:nucleoside-diphosphate-sugar epimerase
MKVLVTGATGFVGRHLVEALLGRGYQVRAVARNVETANAMPWIGRVEFIAADIHSETLDIAALVQDVDVLAHLAWPGLPNYQALFHIEHNLMADYGFIKAVVEAGIAQVLVTGTCFEYGMKNGPLDEETTPRPSNSYALAKNTLRVFLEQLQNTHPFNLQWVRLFYLYGEGQAPGSLLAALDSAIDASAPVFNMSGGEQLRDYLSIEKAADYLVKIMRQRDFSGVVNCCSGQPIAVRSLVEQRLLLRGASMHLNLGHYPYPSHEAMAFWGGADRLQQLIGADDEA